MRQDGLEGTSQVIEQKTSQGKWIQETEGSEVWEKDNVMVQGQIGIRAFGNELKTGAGMLQGQFREEIRRQFEI